MTDSNGAKVVFANQAGGVYTRSGFRSAWLPALPSAGLAHKAVDEKGEPVKNAQRKPVIVPQFRFH